MRAALLLSALLACSSCSVIEQPSGLIARWTTAWKEVATEDDRPRLADWRTTFVTAVDAAKKAGHSDRISPRRRLFSPTRRSALPRSPTAFSAAGSSRSEPRRGQPRLCRLSRLLLPSEAGARAAALQQIWRLAALCRPVFPADAVRQVFLGTLVLGDETRALSTWP